MAVLEGFEKLSHDLDEAKKAMEGLESELGVLEFDPFDPASIEAAIQKAEHLVDGRLGQYDSNPIVSPISKSLKEAFRQGIIERAVTARLEKDNA